MDKRRYRRVAYKGAKILCYSPEEARGAHPYNFATHLVDVSPVGACILSVGRLRPKVHMIVDIFFTQHQGGFRVPALVRWSKEVEHRGQALFMTGLEFLSKPDYSGRALDAVLGHEPPGPETKMRSARENRRRVARVRVDVAEIVCVPSGLLAGLGMRRNLARSLLDLSQHGARFVSRRILSPGRLVKLSLRIPRLGDVFKIVGRVRWCRPDPTSGRGERHIVGVEFEEVPEKHRALLHGLDQWFGRP